jgi:hypothetical protein
MSLSSRLDRLEQLEPADDGPDLWQCLDGSADPLDLRGRDLEIWNEMTPVLFGPDRPDEDDSVEKAIREIVTSRKGGPAESDTTAD